MTQTRQTAIVTGASRGVGRGIACSLADAGWKVYGTGRSIEMADLPNTVIRIRCDHTQEEHTAAAFSEIENETGQLDVLVNSAWGGYEKMVEDGQFTWMLPFWQQPAHRWTGMMEAGGRPSPLHPMLPD